LQLSDLGAEVIKIEDPASGGDVGRYVPPYQEGEDSLFFETFNRGKLSISLFETALHQLCYVGTWAATAGYVPERLDNSAHPSIVPFQNFPTADGWIVIACAKEHFWSSLCATLERPDLLEDERFIDFAARLCHREALVAIPAVELARRPAREWVELLGSAGVPCAVVNTVAAALADPRVEAREALVEIEHPHLGTVRQIASPLRVDGARRHYERAPLRDEHRIDVLRRVCGYDDDAIDIYARDGAFG